MINYTFTRNGYTFERIPKNQARRAYQNGLTVILCPCNLNPCSPWGLACPVNSAAGAYGFDEVVNGFEIYNCIDRETGRYAAYYIPVEEVDRFTGEPPTARTLGTVKQYAYSYMEA